MTASNARILAVDDMPANLLTMGAALGDEFDLQIATSGQMGLALAAEMPPDLILLDVMMPEMDGMETLKRLRDTAWGHRIPVILITADNRVETQLEGLGLGADDFLTKPIEVPVLRARARIILERYRLEREQAELLKRLEAANQELLRLSELNALLLSSAGAGIFSTDQAGICTSANPAAGRLLGFEEGEILGQDWHLLFHKKDDIACYARTDCPKNIGDTCNAREECPLRIDSNRQAKEDSPIFKTLQDGLNRDCEDYFIRRDGILMPIHLTVTPMLLDGKQIGVEVVFEDISERKRMERELFLMATTDPLTGALNRRRFFELGEAEHLRVARYGHPSSLLMLDLDHFKSINDLHGHSTGDDVLRKFAQAVTKRLRTVDILGRIGGEEFAILLPETGLAGAMEVAGRLREAVEAILIIREGHRVPVTVSIGVTELCGSDTSLESALHRADNALYAAKAGGRNRAVAAGASRSEDTMEA